MSVQPPASRASEIMRFFRSPAFKLFLIGGIIIVLLIPLVLVLGLVDERQQRSSSVVSEIAGSWGGAQALAGRMCIQRFVCGAAQIVRSNIEPNQAAV